MGLLDNTTPQSYYQGNDHGNYQFTSLDAIINQFEVAYVGENKIIPKINRADIAFHAQRALQELSFDTLKSCKSQEITVPASLKMILPQDYVDYTHISWVDSSGIKHPLYYTYNTNNPFTIAQDEDGTYDFGGVNSTVFSTNGDFLLPLSPDWIQSTNFDLLAGYVGYDDSANFTPSTSPCFGGNVSTAGNKVTFQHQCVTVTATGALVGSINWIYQEIDVSSLDTVSLSANGNAVNTTAGAAGILRVGLSTSPPGNSSSMIIFSNLASFGGPMSNPVIFDLTNTNGDSSYLEWTVSGDNTLFKTVEDIDVSNTNTIYAIAVSYHEHSAAEYLGGVQDTNNVDDIFVFNAGSVGTTLINPSGNETNSVTWNSYKSNNPSENQDDYKDDIYWPMQGNRYGLDPQHAQANGSFYIDCRLGKIHFSSNISGKTVILDYISDSLGTDGEMQVHKFAEDAMYKCIAHAILSTSSYGQQLVPRLIKEKFAAVRKAKLRLSNLKLGELTQILRGKSKQIKH